LWNLPRSDTLIFVRAILVRPGSRLRTRRTIQVLLEIVMPAKGDYALMSFDFAHSDRPASSDVGDGFNDFGLRATWGETIVTAVAASLAIMVVAAVALLMGMT
jgi:hypothetical protein